MRRIEVEQTGSSSFVLIVEGITMLFIDDAVFYLRSNLHVVHYSDVNRHLSSNLLRFLGSRGFTNVSERISTLV